MDERDPQQRPFWGQASLISGRSVGLLGHVSRPFWGLLGTWAVLCGVVASHRFQWQKSDLLTLGLVWFLSEVAWGSLWSLAVGTDWFRLLGRGWPPEHPASVVALPYTHPRSPGGRLHRWLSRFLGWCRETLWPEAGASLLGLLGALLLTRLLSLFLPARFRLLQAILAAVIGLGLLWRCRGRAPLAGEAFVLTVLGWWAGHLAFAPPSGLPLMLAPAFALAVWGSLRLERGLRGGVALLNAGQVLAAVLLVVLQRPVAAAAVGLLVLGQGAFQLTLQAGGERAVVARRIWPWLMASMALAAWVVP